jgi:ankyrin repeat protein
VEISVLIAGHVEILNFMPNKCTAEVDARNAMGFTPLMKAALQGRTKCAKLLLFAGMYASFQNL